MIELQFQDGEETPISELNIGNVNQGDETNPFMFRVANTGDSDVVVQLYCDESDSQLGTADETYLSSWLSLDDHNYLNRVFAKVDSDDFIEVYLKWRPSHMSLTGEKQWCVKFVVMSGNVEDICDPLT